MSRAHSGRTICPFPVEQEVTVGLASSEHCTLTLMTGTNWSSMLVILWAYPFAMSKCANVNNHLFHYLDLLTILTMTQQKEFFNGYVNIYTASSNISNGV